jgi:hypothetical protein
MEYKNFWLIFRIVTLLTSAFQAQSLSTSMEGDFSKANWATFFILIGFSAFGIYFATSIQTINRFSPPQWDKPSWYSNPFKFGQPLSAFDLASYCLLIIGIISAFFGMKSSPPSYAWEIPLSAGIGAWIGVRICLMVFSDRFKP